MSNIFPKYPQKESEVPSNLWMERKNNYRYQIEEVRFL